MIKEIKTKFTLKKTVPKEIERENISNVSKSKKNQVKIK